MKSKILLITAFSFSASLLVGSCSHSCSKQNQQGDSLSNTKKVKDTLTVVPLTGRAKQLTDLSYFIAGLQVDSTSKMYSFSLTPAWKSYSEESKSAWETIKTESDKIIEWRSKELPDSRKQLETLFYPFGGPDYLFANLFFPNAKNYILIGLESPGTVPQIDSSNKDSLKYILNQYKKALEDVIQLTFFKTVDMKTDLKNKAIDGTAPIIMLFLARSGKQIIDVTPGNIIDDGKIVLASGMKNHNVIKIDFKNPGDTNICHIFYITTNLADPSISVNKAMSAYLSNLDPKCITMLKSASYLMHKPYFSLIRNTIFSKSTMILQDDSGIGYHYYDQSKWNITLIGTYTKPIPMFAKQYEDDLFEAYKNVSRPINFRYGYNTSSNILIAIKK